MTTHCDTDIDLQEQDAQQTEPLNLLARFIGSYQLDAINDGLAGEERDFFVNKIEELADRITNMPTTYETDGQGEDAIAYLHYFVSGFDWYVVEKDMLHEQLQAFGLVRMWESELGYININELRENQVQLDMYWEPKPLKAITGGDR